MKAKPKTVGFQLDDEYLKRLEDEASKYEMSAGQYARRLVMDTLDDTDRKLVREELSAVSEGMKDLRLSLADAVEALLVTAGQYPKEKARAWVDENIRAG